MSKPTKGPWTAAVNGTPNDGYNILDAHGRYIGFVDADDEEISTAEAAANARLVAAAPEMLSALHSLVAGVDDIEAAWPKIDAPAPLDEMCGFLFATSVMARTLLTIINGGTK